METWTLDGKQIDIYVVGPADSKFTVVFVQDIFSIHAGRIKALADFLGDRGYRVVCPDWHKGDSMILEPDFGSKIGAWLGAHPHDEVVKMAEDCFNKIRGDGKKIASVGFCWGTWILYHCQKAGIAMDGCVCLHPSLRIEDMQGRSHSELLKGQNCPVMVAAAGNDPDWTHPGGEWEQSSKAQGFGDKSKFYSFMEMQHGWTARGDISDEKVARDVDLSFQHILEFFKSI